MSNWREKYLNKVTCGDTRELLRTLPDESVDCVITSPPYWGLRDYGLPDVEWGDGWSGSLGLEPTFQLYIDHLMQVMGECKRVLKKTGTMWVNIGDSYCSSGGASRHFGYRDPKYKNGRAGNFIEPSALPQTVLPKSLIGIPERFAIRMTDDLGLIRRNTIIWWKRNAMPSSVKDRFTVDFEPMYFFTKSGRYWFEQQKEEHQSPVGKLRNRAVENYNNSYPGGHFSQGERTMYGKDGRNRRTVWDIPTKPFAAAHFAVFPEELVTIPILSGCPPKGIVLDPFAGSGTTVLAAVKNGREGIGFDLNPQYTDMRFDHIQAETAKIRIPFIEYEDSKPIKLDY